MPVTGFSKRGSNIHVDGYPTAERTAVLDCDEARTLADLRLHESDLRFIQKWLPEIRRASARQDEVMAYGYWVAAIVRYSVCFGGASRRALDLNLIHGIVPNGLYWHEHFLVLRSKTIAHDINAFSDGTVGVVVNPRELEPRILDSLSVVRVMMPSDEDVARLAELAERAFAYVQHRANEAATALVRRASQLSNEELESLPQMTTRTPMPDEVGLTRGANPKKVRKKRRRGIHR
jgi:hypothetical protein